jgi:N-acetyl-gamma-glutamyl-phosphate reductase
MKKSDNKKYNLKESNGSIKVSVIGGAGYTGYELLKILGKHKYAQPVLVTSNTNKGKKIIDVFPSLQSYGSDFEFKSTESLKNSNLQQSDVVFLCLPPFESMDFAGKYLKTFNGCIIDIGSDFRLRDAEDYKFWYGKEHTGKQLLKTFVYALPEINRPEIKKAKNIANPGCYPTSILLALAPLLSVRENAPGKNKPVEVIDINIDSKSGVSGAGKKMKEMYLYCSINENFYAYSALGHRHIGEIEQEINKLWGRNAKICFTPHLIPVDRGIFTSIYCRIETSKNACELEEYINDLYNGYYGDSYFVKFLGEKIPQIKDVSHTNFCHIGFAYDGRTSVLKIFSAIDNLIKGAAGQAVQNMNIIFNFDEQEGIGY